MKISPSSVDSIITPCGLKDIDYQIDPYIGCEHYCYYCYVLPQAETDWTREILIHDNIIDRLGRELDLIDPQTIYLGYHTDPYQPLEAELFQTRRILELLLDKGFSASILTKSDLVLRDLDIIGQMAHPHVSVSVAFNDNQTRKLFEAHTMDTEKRIEVLRQCCVAGIPTGALLCPIIPHITDPVQLIEMLSPHTKTIWLYGLGFMDPSGVNWLKVRDILSRHFTDQADLIESALFSTDHDYWANLRKKLTAFNKNRQLNLNIHI